MALLGIPVMRVVTDHIFQETVLVAVGVTLVEARVEARAVMALVVMLQCILVFVFSK
jgi:hypothetical protein